ncbi:MAG: hypothetical protein HY557_04300 [Euryarchaeota archaeon]|nr:hypothetical protein [Euryarchaeota archaeon]
MRPRDAFALTAVLLLVGIAVVALALQPTGGMMDGMMGGMMGGFVLGILILAVAVVLLVVSVVGGATTSTPYPSPRISSPPPVSPVSHAPSPVTSDVEAAIVRMLSEDERLLYLRIRDAGGVTLQKDIVGWGTFSAAKVTRLLDRLERKGLLVRERYGATNRIRLSRQASISGK